MIKNNRISIALTLLIICLVGSLSTVNATVITNDYSIHSYDVTVKQGEPVDIKARLTKFIFPFFIIGVPDAELKFLLTAKIDNGFIFISKTATTDGNGMATCTFNTPDLAPGNYNIFISSRICAAYEPSLKICKLTITP